MRTINIRLLSLLLVGAIAVSAAGYAVHQFQVRRNAQGLLRQAELAKQKKNFAEAIDYLERYITLAPGDVVAPLADLALLQADVGLSGPAFRNAESVLRQDAKRSDVRRRQVDIAVSIERYPDARHHVEILLKDTPRDCDLLILLARCQIAMGEYPVAVDKLTQTFEIDPSRLEAYSRLADLLHDQIKDAGGALSILDKMVEANAQDYRVYILRGNFRLKHPNSMPERSAPGASDQAASDQSAAAENQEQADTPKTTPSREEDALDAAVADANRSLEVAPDEIEVIEFAVRCYLASDDREAAREQARRGLTLHPRNAAMYIWLANVESSAGHADEAISCLMSGLAATFDSPDLLWSLSNLLIDSGRIEEARTTLKKLHLTRYSKAAINFLESRILVEEGEWQKALNRFEELRPALTQFPDLLKAADFWMGRCYASLGQNDQQLIAFRRALGVDSRWLPVRLGIAGALMSTGRIEEALDEYRQIVNRTNRPPLAVLEQLARLEIMVNLGKNPDSRNWKHPGDILDALANADPESASVPILRAEILVAQGKDAEAEELLLAVRERSPQTVEFHLGLAALAQRREDWEQAWELFDEAQAAIGDSVQIRLARARLLAIRDRADAKDPIRELARADKSFTLDERITLYSGLAPMTLSIQDFEETERLCRLVAKEQPLNLPMRLLLFDLAFRAGNLLVMAQVLDEVQSIERSGPLWHYGEAVRLSVMAKQRHQPELYADAKRHLAEARVVRSAWSRIPLLLAQINELEGDEESAISNFAEAIQLGEHNPGIISHAVGLLYQRNRFLEADLLIRRLQEQQGPFSNEMARLAVDVSLKLNDTVRGLDLVTKTAKTSSDPNDHLWAGRIFSSLGQNDEAEASFRRAIKLDESFVEGWVGLIQHFGRTSQLQKAEGALIEAQQNINPAEAPTALARALESIGRIDEAEANYKAALAAAPDEIPTLRRLADFYLRHGNEREAKPLLSRLLGGLKGATDDDRMWGRRCLALALVARDADAAATKQALALVDENLAIQPASKDDRRARAMVLAFSPDRSARREAAEIIEKMLGNNSSLPVDAVSELRFVLAQLYVSLDDASKATSNLRILITSADERNSRYPRYLSFYVRFLVNRNEISDAALWLPGLQKLAPREFSTLELAVEIEFNQKRYAGLLSKIDQFLADPAMNDADRPIHIGRSAQLLETLAGRLENAGGEDESREWAARFLERADLLFNKYAQELPQDALARAAYLGRHERHSESLDILEEEWARAQPQQIAIVTATLIGSRAATQEHYARAVEVLRAALDKHERPLMLVMALADLQNLWERFDEAETLYQEVLQKQPQNPGALNNYALLLALRGRGIQKSIAMIEKAIEVVGPDPALLDTRATISLLLGKSKSAAADVERAIAARPTAIRYFHQSQVEQKLGKHAAARESLAKANELGLHVEQLHPLERPVYRQLTNELQ